MSEFGEEWESGPYCRHFFDPSDCEECEKLCPCGHRIRAHGLEIADGCMECACPERHRPL